MRDVGEIHALERAKTSLEFNAFPKPPSVSATAWTYWLQSLNVEAICAYAWKAKPGWTLDMRRVDDSMWFYFSSGQGRGACEALPDGFEFSAGTALFIPRGAWHWLKLDRGNLKFYTVHFQATVLSGFEALDWLGFPTLVKKSKACRFAEVSEFLAREHIFSETRSHAVLSSEIRALLFRLARSQAEQFRPRFAEYSASASKLLQQALRHCDRHISDPNLSVTNLASEVNVSTSYLNRVFKQLLNTSPNCHIRRIRLRRACELLIHSDQSAAEVAYACGFSDPAYFHRVFQAEFTCTPGQYRHRAAMRL